MSKEAESTIKIEEPEFIQTIQTPNNDVRLFMGKDIYARYFFSREIAELENLQVRGKLTINCDGVSSSIEKEQRILVGPVQSKLLQRLNWDRSLNFRVGASHINTTDQDTVNAKLTLSELSVIDNSVTFQSKQIESSIDIHSSELKVRILAIRYRDADSRLYLEPSDAEIDAVRRKLNALFPIRRLGSNSDNWSYVRVEAKDDFRALTTVPEMTRANGEVAAQVLYRLLTQVLLHREYEITHCRRDPKTIYLALIVDPSQRFGGVAMDSPRFPTPHMVGIASTDGDGGLAAHEIAHMLGRQHPGIPSAFVYGEQVGQHGFGSLEGATASFQPKNRHGFICKAPNSDLACIGIDSSKDRERPELINPDRYFDLMTYLYPQWISRYNYEGIATRIQNINKRKDLIVDKGNEKCWTVICKYNLDKKEGQILSVSASNFVTPRPTVAPDEFDEKVKNHLDPKKEADPELLAPLNPDEHFNLFVPLNGREESSDEDRKDYLFNIFKQLLAEYDIEVINGAATTNSIKSNMQQDESNPTLSAFEGTETNPIVSVTIEYTHARSGKSEMKGLDKVYYRHIGNEKRFPFGLLQHTIKIPDQFTELKNVTLRLDKFLADTIDLPKEVISEGTASFVGKSFVEDDSIEGEKALEEEVTKEKSTKPSHISSIKLIYHPRKDVYRLCIRYSPMLLDKIDEVAQITTTILAKRPFAEDRWEVISVREGLEQSFWVSEEFIEPHVSKPKESKLTKDVYAKEAYGRFVENRLARPVHYRKRDLIIVRVFVKIGATSPELSGTNIGIEPTSEYFKLNAEVKEPRITNRDTQILEANEDDMFVEFQPPANNGRGKVIAS